jgi:hypothetical protein
MDLPFCAKGYLRGLAKELEIGDVVRNSNKFWNPRYQALSFRQPDRDRLQISRAAHNCLNSEKVNSAINNGPAG